MNYRESYLFNLLRNRLRKYPQTEEEMRAHKLYNTFWFYSVELLPGVIAKGQFPEKMPLPARMLLRNCDLKGADCLDIGSMEGLIPTLMCRQGARNVLATDFSFHAYAKMAAIKKYYDVDFDFKRIGLLYELSKKIPTPGLKGFDLINLSGVLYHVFSPLHVLAGLRPLLKKNGLFIISTNVIERDDFSMEFNDHGKLQVEPNTFWYISIRLLDYMLRYFQLQPIDCVYYKYGAQDKVRYVKDLETGYMSLICRAVDDRGAGFNDPWLSRSINEAWEYLLCDQKMLEAQGISKIGYRGGSVLNVSEHVRSAKPFTEAEHPHDTHLLRLADRI